MRPSAYTQAKEFYCFTDSETNTSRPVHRARAMAADTRNDDPAFTVVVHARGSKDELATGDSISAAFWASGYEQDGVLVHSDEGTVYVPGNAIGSINFKTL